MPYQLVNPSSFRENEPMTKEEFLKKYMGPEKFAKVNAAIAKWAEEKGKPMYGGPEHVEKLYLTVYVDQFFPWRVESINPCA